MGQSSVIDSGRAVSEDACRDGRRAQLKCHWIAADWLAEIALIFAKKHSGIRYGCRDSAADALHWPK